MWDPVSRCGADVIAVSPFTDASNPVSIALLRVIFQNSTVVNTTYVRIRVDQNTSVLLGVDILPHGNEFYSALLAQANRWNTWVDQGSKPIFPTYDQRYSDTA